MNLRKAIVSLFLILHLGALALNALPWSAFVEKLYVWYGPYIYLTRQHQTWGMYQFPDHFSANLDYVSRRADGTLDYPWGEKPSARQLYFIEGLVLKDKNEPVARAFLRRTLRETEKNYTESSFVFSKRISPRPMQRELTQENQIFHKIKEIREVK